MTAQRLDATPNAARLQCRQCGFLFGRVFGDRHQTTFTPGLHIMVDLTLQRIDVVCPKCGLRRSFTNVVLSAMTIPKIPA